MLERNLNGSVSVREEFRLHGALTPERQEALIDLLEEVQAHCIMLLDTPKEDNPAYPWFKCWEEIHNVTYGE